MPNFTKSKWIYDAKKGFITADGYTIITVCYPQTPEAQAVGRLVESAPEMYEVMKTAYELGHLNWSLFNSQKAKELINRIEGDILKGSEISV